MTRFEDDFLGPRGIDLAVWEEQGCIRYEQGEVEKVWREIEPFAPNQYGWVCRIVKQCGGWIMPKRPPEGFPPICPQLRPDHAVWTKPCDPRTGEPWPDWHYHGPLVKRDGKWVSPLTGERPAFPPEAGEKLAGRPLPVKVKRKRRNRKTGKWEEKWVKTGCVLRDEEATSHIEAGKPYNPKTREGDHPYNDETGEGKHFGKNIDYVHKHAPTRGKYLHVPGTDPSRIDMPPLAVKRLLGAKDLFVVMEGCPKTCSVLTAGGCAIGVPSVTNWEAEELELFIERFLSRKRTLRVWIVPDADWASNPQVARQAFKMRDVFRRKGITHADVAAPPTEAECEAQDIDFYKGVDDMLGAGNNLGDLVIDRYEAPHEAIRNAVEANCSRQRRKWAIWAIEDLSLNVYCPERERKPRGKHGEWRGGFLTMRGLLGQERSDRAARLVRAIQWCFTIEEGSTETEKRKVPYEEIIVTTWKDNKPLRLTLKEEYRAHEERDRLKVADFWQRATVQGLLDDVDDLKRRVVGIENAA